MHPYAVRLGRKFAPDSRDHMLRMALVPTPTPPRTYRFWVPGPVLNQGDTPHCVGFAWEGFLNASPTRTKPGPGVPSGDDIYVGAQQNDEWEGPPPPYDGTSVRGGAKFLHYAQRVGEYAFDTDLTVIKNWILEHGPVVFGTNWYEEMFDPGPDGVAHINGPVAGGHAYLVTGWSDRHQMFKARNSWGPDWGVHGNFWLRLEDARRLLEEDGEACATIETVPPAP